VKAGRSWVKHLSTTNEIPRPVIILIGGFLGAGKTTLILTAARILEGRGIKAAAIFNDQGAELVDTHYARQAGIEADQVTGGCFCCRFSDLIDTAERLREHALDVIFAEAVGSCTDISATTLQPLKLSFAHDFRLAPYTVLVDPGTARELSATEADPELSFLFRKQIEEADLVCFNKTDIYTDVPQITRTDTQSLSAATGDGVQAWLAEVLLGQIEAGGNLLEIDYRTYAKAEAKLAWLNCSLTLTAADAVSPASVIGPLMESLDAALTANQLKIAHVKLLDECESGYIKASIARNGDEPIVEGVLNASGCTNHRLLINARAVGSPAMLERLVRKEVSELPGSVGAMIIQCFSPAPPTPEHRLMTIVKVSEGEGCE